MLKMKETTKIEVDFVVVVESGKIRNVFSDDGFACVLFAPWDKTQDLLRFL